MVSIMSEIQKVVYTDGACSGNPGPGGWAWVVPNGPFAAGYEPSTTNQRMELQATLEAIKSIDGPLLIVSDSTYVVHCFRDRWWEGWIRRGWVNSQKKPVANQDLWKPLLDLYLERENIEFEWVKGILETVGMTKQFVLRSKQELVKSLCRAKQLQPFNY